ncbi:MAG: four helix bundle protein [Planctomycetota bacterium]|jgi:hypothetical protein
MFQSESERGPLFDFERLIVYQKTMQLRRLINPLTSNPPKGAAHLVDHLDRAVDSVLLNVPEGNGFPRGSENGRTTSVSPWAPPRKPPPR